MYSIAEVCEEKEMDEVHKNINESCKTSEEASRSLQVKFNLNIIEEKEENSSKPSNKLLGDTHRPLLSSEEATEPSITKTSCVNKKDEVLCFRRTLKMLGFEPKDFGVGADGNSQPVNTLSPRRAPALKTRLRERTVSLENLRTALQDIVTGTPSGEKSREMLARAAYEEWYFKKMEMAKKLKRIQTTQQENRDKGSLEHKQKAQENFNKWLAQKNLELRHNRKKKKKQEQKPSPGPAPAGDKDVADAFMYWKKQKDKVLRQRKLNEQEKESGDKPQEDDREEKEKRFQMWKRRADQALRAKAEEESRKQRQVEERKRREEEDRKREAEAAFLAWKKAKDEQLKKESAHRRHLTETTQREQMKRQLERCYESEQAFEEWLDEVEERQRNQSERHSHVVKDPWSPAGSTNWLHSV